MSLLFYFITHFNGVRVAQSLVFSGVFCISLIILFILAVVISFLFLLAVVFSFLFLLAVVFSFLFRFTALGYSFVIV